MAEQMFKDLEEVKHLEAESQIDQYEKAMKTINEKLA